MVLLHQTSELIHSSTRRYSEHITSVVAVHLHTLVLRVVEVQQAATHACSDVSADVSKGYDDAICHVLAQVVARALDDRLAARVAHPEALTDAAVEEDPSASGAIKARVACNHAVNRHELAVWRRYTHKGATVHSLPDVVVALAGDMQVHSLDVEDAERLSSRSGEVQLQLAIEAIVPVKSCNVSSNAATNRTIDVPDRQINRD
mmetsp:Transcript_60827/g.98484  ORF Transcript_60827/g.98484 Transcript_60827/m.98484 type:complete len:204 (-) Transcript_60827:185-796(-)